MFYKYLVCRTNVSECIPVKAILRCFERDYIQFDIMEPTIRSIADSAYVVTLPIMEKMLLVYIYRIVLFIALLARSTWIQFVLSLIYFLYFHHIPTQNLMNIDLFSIDWTRYHWVHRSVHIRYTNEVKTSTISPLHGYRTNRTLGYLTLKYHKTRKKS